MSTRYPGGIISKTAPVPSGPFETSTAPGVWTLEQQAYWQKQGLWPTAGNVDSDPNFRNVSLLLTGDGTNGAQNNTFLDSSANNFAITRNGNTTQGSFSPYGPNWSNFLPGAGNYLSTSGNAIAFGSGNYTVEGFINLSSTSTTQLLVYGSTANSFYIRIGQSFGVVNGLGIGRSGVSDNEFCAFTFIPGVWYHIAVVRASSVIYFFVNGVQQTTQGSGTSGFSFVTPTLSYICGAPGSSEHYNGYTSNLRILNGTALYTSNFTPPTAPLTAVTNTSLLTCQSNRFVDNSTNNFAITVNNAASSVQRFSPFNPTAPYSTSVIGGSGYFDGTGDYLQLGANSAFSFNADFTVEAWCYPTIIDQFSLNAIFSLNINGDWNSQGNGLVLSLGSLHYGNTNVNFTSIQTNAWSHLAVVRSGSTIKLYVNGVEIVSVTSSLTLGNGTSNQPAIGLFDQDRFPLVGYVSNLRVVKGTAVYTSNFTPPTAPVTAITNTSLLTNFTNAGIPDAAMINNLETVGGAQVSTAVVKYGTGSLAFDGTGDVLTAPANTAFILDADFTIEGWVYPITRVRSFPAVFNVGVEFGTGANIILYFDHNANRNEYDLYVNNTLVIRGTIAPGLNVWNYFAITRSGNTWRLFVNGVLDASATRSDTVFSGNPPPLAIASETATRGITDFAGYIDDFRITNGIARYTANFTPPTRALQTF